MGFRDWKSVHLLHDPQDGTDLDRQPELDGFSSEDEGLLALWNPGLLPCAWTHSLFNLLKLLIMCNHPRH